MKNCLLWHCLDVAGPETKITNGPIQKTAVLWQGKLQLCKLLPDLPDLPEITVTDAVPEENSPYPEKDKDSAYPEQLQRRLKVHASLPEKEQTKRYLLKKTETIIWETELPDKIAAPVRENQKIGTLHAMLNGKKK